MKPCINLFTVPLWVHIIAFVQLVFNHLVTANLHWWTSDIHPRQRHSEKTKNKCRSFTQSISLCGSRGHEPKHHDLVSITVTFFFLSDLQYYYNSTLNLISDVKLETSMSDWLGKHYFHSRTSHPWEHLNNNLNYSHLTPISSSSPPQPQ